MSFPQLPSGLAGLLTDAREFALAVRFARPELLWLLLVLPLLAAANWCAAGRRRRSTAAVGRPGACAEPTIVSILRTRRRPAVT